MVKGAGYTDQRIVEHAAQVEAMVDRAVALFSTEADEVVGKVLSHFSVNLEVEGSKIKRSGKNAETLGGARAVYDQAIKRSGYSAVAAAVASVVVDRVGEVRKLLAESGVGSNVELNDEELAVLSKAATHVVKVLDAHANRVGNNLVEFLGHSFGQEGMAELNSGLSRSLRALSNVKPLLLEHNMTLVKLAGKIIYDRVESQGVRLMYRYVGPPATRSFCKNILGRSFTREEVDGMNNGRGLSVLTSGGGYACKHWFLGEGN